MNNLMKNITPSIAVMAVGLAGAFFVYNVYFKNDVNSTFSSIEPAAGEEVVAEEGMMEEAGEMASDAYDATAEAVEDAAEATEEMAEDAVEATEDMIDGEDNVVEEAAEETEEAVEEAGEEAEAAADEMHDEAKH